MNELVTTAFIFSAIFIGLGLLFLLSGENGTNYISGFNTLPKDRREGYDKKRIVADMRNRCLKGGLVSLAGGLLAMLFHDAFAILGILAAAVLFFQGRRWTAEKTFENYKLPDSAMDAHCPSRRNKDRGLLMLEKLKATLLSENGMKIVNPLCMLSVFIGEKVLKIFMFTLWLIFLVYSIKRTQVKTMQVIYALMAVFAMTMIVLLLSVPIK